MNTFILGIVFGDLKKKKKNIKNRHFQFISKFGSFMEPGIDSVGIELAEKEDKWTRS